jgi:alpha-ketoglutarate-dependent taurine dioxygenase
MDATNVTTGLQTSPFTADFGAIVVNDGQDILSLDLDDVMQVFRSSGFVLFRGFETGEQGFTAFTDKFTDRFLGHGNMNRKLISEDGTLMTVTPGTHLIHAHNEMAYSPLRPDAIWFHCVQPASEGGETVVVDGVRVVGETKAETRELLSAKKVKHRFRNVAPEAWQRLLRTSNLSEALCMLDSFPGFTYEMNAAGSLDAAFVTPAIKSTKYGRHLAFNSSMLDVGGTFDDDSEIPREIFRELRDVTCELSHLIAWQPDDVAMIDNTRILHGRRPFTDVRRSLRIRMGNIEA